MSLEHELDRIASALERIIDEGLRAMVATPDATLDVSLLEQQGDARVAESRPDLQAAVDVDKPSQVDDASTPADDAQATVSLEDVKAAARAFSSVPATHDQIMAVMKQLGVNNLDHLKPAQYADALDKFRVAHAQLKKAA